MHSTANLGNALKAQGKYVEAEKLLRQTLETMRRDLGERHPDTLVSIHNLAEVLAMAGMVPEAEALYEESVAGSG